MKLTHYFNTAILLLMLSIFFLSCRNELVHYYLSQSSEENNIGEENNIRDYEIHDSIMNIHCYDAFPKERNNRITVLFNFQTNEIYTIDSLDVNVTFDNGENLAIYSFHDRKGWNDSITNIQEVISANKLITKPYSRMTNYICHFTGDKSHHPKYLILRFKIKLSNDNDTLHYNKEFKLYPNVVVFYD